MFCLASGGTPPSRSRDIGRARIRPPGHGGAYASSGHELTRLTGNRIETLAKSLTPEEREILLAEGTEQPFCGVLLNDAERGPE